MPKVKLGRDLVRDRAELRKRLVSAKAHLRGYAHQQSVANATGISEAKYNRILRGEGPWSLDDLAAIDKLLKFTDAELAQIVRGR